MIDLTTYRRQIEEACHQFDVKRLELFGSGVREDFSQESDIDVLVEFNNSRSRGISDRYFGLMNSLSSIFHRSVDLVDINALSNPYFIERLNKEKVLIYER